MIVRIAVVGAGVMGANHARIARSLRDAELVAVIDADLDRARSAAGPDVHVAPGIDELGTVVAVDLAVVAVPTPHHADVAVALAERGINLLVEKPLAGSILEAERIIAAAEAAGVVLAVGHIERFNAAVAELPRLVADPIHVRATRVSPYSARIGDGVIHDLMIHDLDIVLALAGPDAEVTSVAGTARSTRSANEDLASVTVAFSTGLTAAFETSRLAQQKVRTLEITQADAVVVADLVRQDVTIHRMSQHEYLSGDGVRYRQSSVLEIPFLEHRGEPLALELAHVAECVRTGAPPRVSGRDGVRALALADRIAAAVHRGDRPS